MFENNNIKTKTGRRTIDDIARVSSSKRAREGIINVIKEKYLCGCGSKKFFVKPIGIQCTKCKRWIEKKT